MSTLRQYLQRHGITQDAFAQQAGLSQSLVSRFCRGAIIPNLRRAVEIERITGGEVAVSSWLPPDPDAAPPLDDSRNTTERPALASVVETVNPEGGA